jgi:hypothetical protein
MHVGIDLVGSISQREGRLPACVNSADVQQAPCGVTVMVMVTAVHDLFPLLHGHLLFCCPDRQYCTINGMRYGWRLPLEGSWLA